MTALEQVESVKIIFRQLEDWQQRLVLIDLLEDGTIKFEKLATQYVEKLQAERTQKQHANAILALMLSSYCINDPSPGGKNARKHLYESGAWTGADGSIFGKQLEEEFSSINNQNKTT